MFIQKNITNDTYKKLMNYVFQTCDVLSLKKYEDQHRKEDMQKIKVILSSGLYSDADVLNNFSEDFLKKLYMEFKDNNELFDESYCNNYEVNTLGMPDIDFQSLVEFNRQKFIEGCVYCFIYEHKVNSWIEKYASNIFKSEEKFLASGQKYSTTYYLKLDSKLKDDILSRKDLFEDWCFPNSIEDLSFFKDGYCWLFSVSHEEICEVYCRDEEEYSYLKSIGVEFVEEQFVSTPKEELYYENYLKD